MPLIILKPDALCGARATVSNARACGFLRALASEFDGANAVGEVDASILAAAGRAHKQVSERRESESSFQGVPLDPERVSAELAFACSQMPKTAVSTEQVLVAAVRALGFAVDSSGVRLCANEDVDIIYGRPLTETYVGIRPVLLEYFVGKEVKWFLLCGPQHPCVLQYWKTYARHLLIERPEGDTSYLVQNLVHVSDGVDPEVLRILCSVRM